MVKVGLFEEVAFILRSKATGMNHAKEEEECSKHMEEFMLRPWGRKSLVGTKNKKERVRNMERLAFDGKKDSPFIVNEKN